MNIKHTRVFFIDNDLALRSLTLAHLHHPGGNNERTPIKIMSRMATAQKAQIKNTLMQARLSEMRPSSHWVTEFYFDDEQIPADNDWQLAAIIADRIGRGLLNHQGSTLALGQADRWQYGKLNTTGSTRYAEKLALIATLPEEYTHIFVGDSDEQTHIEPLQQAKNEQHKKPSRNIQIISHLGGLHGHPDPTHLYRKATVYFPVVCGELNAELVSINVTAWPLLEHSESLGSVQCQLSNRKKREEVESVLQQARHYDATHCQQWATYISFSREDFIDNSWQLAAVLADRIARGRQLPAQGTLYATGCSSDWAQGGIEAVGGIPAKLAYLSERLKPQDCLMIPGTCMSPTIEQTQSMLKKNNITLLAIDKLPRWV